MFYVTDTLGNPYVDRDAVLGDLVAPIAESRKEANRIKREEPITVVIGNPPYKEKAKGRGGWIESGQRCAARSCRADGPMDAAAGVGRRRARQAPQQPLRLLLALGDAGRSSARADAATGDKEQTPGIVCFITVAGFLNGPGFQKMRDYLRRDCARHLGHRLLARRAISPRCTTRIFQGVQQPVCIVLAARTPNKDRNTPARLQVHGAAGGPAREQVRGARRSCRCKAAAWRDGPTGLARPVPAGARRRVGELPAAGGSVRLRRLGRDAGAHLDHRAGRGIAGGALATGSYGEKDPHSKRSSSIRISRRGAGDKHIRKSFRKGSTRTSSTRLEPVEARRKTARSTGPLRLSVVSIANGSFRTIGSSISRTPRCGTRIRTGRSI